MVQKLVNCIVCQWGYSSKGMSFDWIKLLPQLVLNFGWLHLVPECPCPNTAFLQSKNLKLVPNVRKMLHFCFWERAGSCYWECFDVKMNKGEVGDKRWIFKQTRHRPKKGAPKHTQSSYPHFWTSSYNTWFLFYFILPVSNIENHRLGGPHRVTSCRVFEIHQSMIQSSFLNNVQKILTLVRLS